MRETSGPAEYWDNRYESIGETKVSWFQPSAAASIDAITALNPQSSASIVDVGGGASMLVDELLAHGFTDVTVVDLSQVALGIAESRLALKRSEHRATFVHADIRKWQPPRTYTIWHDRAAYHFLTDPADQRHYWDLVRAHMPAGGHVVIATFAEDGPEMCSGLPVQRNSAEQLIAAMGEGFTPLSTSKETHTTPSGGEQRFIWVTARRN